MPTETLDFHQIGSFSDPGNPMGYGMGLTVARLQNDPALVYVGQSSWDDEVVFVDLDFGNEVNRWTTPGPEHQTISGLAFDWKTEVLWGSPGSNYPGVLNSYDVENGTPITSISTRADFGHGLAFNGRNLVQDSSGQGPPHTGALTSELLMVDPGSGDTVASLQLPDGQKVRAFTWGRGQYYYSEVTENLVHVVDSAGTEIAVFTPPGPPGKTEAIAFDYARDYDQIPGVLCEPLERVGAQPGDPCHPDTPWDPSPWQDRHRLYLANQEDHSIRFGYLTA